MPLYLTYYFWLLLVSAVMFTLERLFPWRREQEILRPGFVQDLFWMVFNIQYVSWMLAVLAVHVITWFDAAVFSLGIPALESLQMIANWPAWAQFAVVFVVKDFLEWNVHHLLHRVPLLWRLHQLHHSTEELDWVAAFRGHWGEIIIYKVVIYLPLVVLGVDGSVIFAIIAVSLVIQELSHANLRWDLGPLRYIISSPRYHAWHHDVALHGKAGQNYGVNLVIWDWIFRTAYWPRDVEGPERYGLSPSDRFPTGIWARLWWPFLPRPRTDLAGKLRVQAEKSADRVVAGS